MKWTIFLMALFLTGCINITTELQPVNPAVKPTLTGEDCVTVLFGIGIGTNRVDTALRAGRPEDAPNNPHTQMIIRSIHSLTMTDIGFLSLVGARCLEVTGEP